MLVLIANDLPPAVAGKLKLWFVEPKPNVFVSGIKDSVADAVIDLLSRHCPPESGLMIFRHSPVTPGYEIYSRGATERQVVNINGLQLIGKLK